MLKDKEKTAQLVKESRLAKGYTQLQLAELTNISLRSVQRIENGEVIPRSYTLKLLANQLDIKLEPADRSPVIAGNGTVAKQGKAKKIILSASLAILVLLLSAAFLSQTVSFPETSFEIFLFWAAVTAVYSGLVLRIWK
jgi:transcriptional regulator with XRE-family HTH domain